MRRWGYGCVCTDPDCPGFPFVQFLVVVTLLLAAGLAAFGVLLYRMAETGWGTR